MQDTTRPPSALVTHSRALGPHGCYLYLSILRYLDGKTDWAALHLRDLAAFSVVSVPTIRKILPLLVDLGLLERRVEAGAIEYRVVGVERVAPKPKPEPEPKQEAPLLFSMDEEQPEPFDQFWQVYPRREGKGQALKAFSNALDKADYAAIVAGARQYAEHCARFNTERQYIRLPATWLNGIGWEDDRTHAPAAKRTRATERLGEYDDL